MTFICTSVNGTGWKPSAELIDKRAAARFRYGAEFNKARRDGAKLINASMPEEALAKYCEGLPFGEVKLESTSSGLILSQPYRFVTSDCGGWILSFGSRGFHISAEIVESSVNLPALIGLLQLVAAFQAAEASGAKDSEIHAHLAGDGERKG